MMKSGKTEKGKEHSNYAASAMRLLPLTHGDGIGLFLIKLVLSISLQVGCWYTVLSARGESAADLLLIPLLTLLGAGCFFLCRKRTMPLTVVLIIAAACGAVAFFLRGTPELLVSAGAAATSLLAGWGLSSGHAVIGAAAAAVPAVWQMAVGGSPDRWYLGLLILCWTASFVVWSQPDRTVGRAAVRRGERRVETEVIGARRRTSDFPAWFLLLVLAAILLFLFLFTAVGFRSSQSLSDLRSAISSSPQTVRQLMENASPQHSGSGSSAERSAADHFDWLQFLLLVLKYLLIMLAVTIAVAIVLYELIMHRRQRRRTSLYGSDFRNRTAFAMYDYIRELMQFDHCRVDNDPYISLVSVVEKYPAAEGIGFEEIVNQITRIRYGSAEERVEPDVHRSMARYCDALRAYIYEKQEKKGRFCMRFVRCYL
ncbi:MAG: hypothetical protein ACOX41_04590 [Anaerovoracaceae bacterium]|jgi:hypothetical protein